MNEFERLRDSSALSSCQSEQNSFLAPMSGILQMHAELICVIRAVFG